MDMKHKVLNGNESFEFGGSTLPTSVKDFWAWSMSRLIADGPRGDLAEFIVNTALGTDISEPKRGWGECDILYPHGGSMIRVEIKCSSLLQAWERSTPPKPMFSISKTLNCDTEDTGSGYRYVGRDGSPPTRRSDIYVFCLFAEEDRAKADPLVLDQWRFYIVPTRVIDERLGDQRRISLQGLHRIGATNYRYDEIKAIIDQISDDISAQRMDAEINRSSTSK